MAIPFLKSKLAETTSGDDPLALFEAESGFSMRDEAGSLPDTDIRNRAVVTSRPLMLETVLVRRTPVLWPEAVAIVEATSAVLRPSDGVELPAPEPSNILLTSEGAVQVRSGINLGFGRGDSVPRLARTLHALTSGQAIPAPLRLLISKWIASDGSHSIAEFAKELTYFARPDGAQLIRDVYMRCLSMPAVEEPRTPAPGEQQRAGALVPIPPKPRRQILRRHYGIWIGAAAAVVLAIGVAVLFSRPRQAGQGDPSDLLATLMARAAEFARSLGEMRTEIGEMRADLTTRLGTGADVASTSPAPKTTSAPSNDRNSAPPAQRAAASPAARRPLTSPPQASARSAATAARPLASAAASPALAAPTVPATPSVALVEALPVATPVARKPAPPDVAAAAADPNALYSNADEDVSPPKLLYPQVPPVPILFATNDDINVMEIVVGDNGSVERVKLLSQPRRLTDMMLLSGAKSWKFAPASRNGQAVRYRMALRWSTTQ